MTIEMYVSQIEASIEWVDRLEQIRTEVALDRAVSELDRGFLDGRIGNYLADHLRQREPAGGWSIEDVPEMDG